MLPTAMHTPVSVRAQDFMALVSVCKGGSSVIYSLGTFVFTQQLFWQHKTPTAVLPGGKYGSQHSESCGRFGAEQVGHRLVRR